MRKAGRRRLELRGGFRRRRSKSERRRKGGGAAAATAGAATVLVLIVTLYTTREGERSDFLEVVAESKELLKR